MERLLHLIARIPHDKLLHFVGGVALFAVSAPLCAVWGGGPLWAAGMVGIVAALKDAYDAAYNRWVAPVHGVALNDALATLAGGYAGWACASYEPAARWLASVIGA